jgi:F0F1-type ATP synthase assembly protein I
MSVPQRSRDSTRRDSSVGSAGEVMGVGLQFAGSILVFLFVGRWLDTRLGTGPWLLLAGVFIGAGAGFYSLYRQLVIVPRGRSAKHQEGADTRTERREQE